MADHFNKLSPQVAELLFILVEELGEVAQQAGKILRHGARENPYTGIENRVTLEAEITDLETVLDLLDEVGLIDRERIRDGIRAKRSRMSRPGIMHHSTPEPVQECGRCRSKFYIQVTDDAGEPVCFNTVECEFRLSVLGQIPF